MPGHAQTKPASAGPLTWIALAALLLLLILAYDPLLIGPEAPFGFLSPLLSSVPFFLGCYGLCIALSLLAVAVERPGMPWRAALGAAVALSLIYPLSLPARYGSYAPYAQPAAGVEMRWLTKPRNAYASAFKEAQRRNEKHGCRYHLLGWDEEGALSYTWDCGRATWRYDPDIGGEPALLSGAPFTAAPDSTVTRFEESVYSPRMEGFAPQTTGWFIVTERADSPDGRWTAAAMHSYYGPGDVVLLARQAP